MTVLGCPECESAEISPRNGRNGTAPPGTWQCNRCGAEFDDPERRPPKSPGGSQSLPGGTLAAELADLDPDDIATDGGVEPVAVYTVSNGQDKPRLKIHQKALEPAGFEPGDRVLVYPGDDAGLRLRRAEWPVLEVQDELIAVEESP